MTKYRFYDETTYYTDTTPTEYLYVRSSSLGLRGFFKLATSVAAWSVHAFHDERPQYAKLTPLELKKRKERWFDLWRTVQQVVVGTGQTELNPVWQTSKAESLKQSQHNKRRRFVQSLYAF